MSREFRLEGVVPWGREAEEYESFFALGDVPPAAHMLDCGGGPSSFTAQRSAGGPGVRAVDPIYALGQAAIRARFEATREPMLEGMKNARGRFVWNYYPSPEAVVARREKALEAFLADRARHPERYVAAALPALPFAAASFDVAVCSHLLFLYSDELSLALHVESLREMLRVAREARVFPLLDMTGKPSRHLVPALSALADEVTAERVAVPFEFQRGATHMLRLRPRTA